MWKRQTGKLENWAHGEVNRHMPGLTLVVAAPSWAAATHSRAPAASTAGGRGLSPTLSHGAPRVVTCAESQSLPLPNNHMRSADMCGGFWSALQVLYLN